MTSISPIPALKGLFGPLPPAAARRRRMAWTQRIRHLSQFAFGFFIIMSSVIHHLSVEDGTTASIDALCPFGGVETLYRFVSSGGQYVPKTHQSNVVLLLGLLAGTIIAGGAFCGWVCPFGGAMDVLTSIRRRLRIPEIRVPERLDRVLRYGRYLMLAIILYQTIASVKLWFAEFDPYRTLFGLDWLFEFDPVVAGLAYGTLIVTLIASFFVERAWCRYACPLGGAISLVGRFSLLRIRRTDTACKACALCERPCPVKLPVATATTISSDCIGCLACVDACPRHGALEVRLSPTWLDSIRARLSRKPATQPTEVTHAR